MYATTHGSSPKIALFIPSICLQNFGSIPVSNPRNKKLIIGNAMITLSVYILKICFFQRNFIIYHHLYETGRWINVYAMSASLDSTPFFMREGICLFCIV